MTLQNSGIGQYLLSHGFINQEQLHNLQDESDLTSLLLSENIVNQSQLEQIESLFAGLPMYDLSNRVIDPAVQSQIPFTLSKASRVVCVDKGDSQVCLVTDQGGIDSKITDLYGPEIEIKPHRVSSQDMDGLLDIYHKQTYQELLSSITNLSKRVRKIEDYGSSVMSEFFPTDHTREIAEDVTVTKLLQRIFALGQIMRASEIFIQTQTDKLLVKMKIAGEVNEVMSLTSSCAYPVYCHLRYICDMPFTQSEPVERGYTQRLDNMSSISHEIDFTSTVTGYSVAIDTHAVDEVLSQMKDLGLSSNEKEKIVRYAERKQGVCLISGKEKSGKTFAYYQLLQAMGTRYHTVSLEKQVEYVVDKVNQVLFGKRLEKDLRHLGSTSEVFAMTPLAKQHLNALVRLSAHSPVITETSEGVMSIVKHARALGITNDEIVDTFKLNLFSHAFTKIDDQQVRKAQVKLQSADIETLENYVSLSELNSILGEVGLVTHTISKWSDTTFYSVSEETSLWGKWKNKTQELVGSDIEKVYIRGLVEIGRVIEKTVQGHKTLLETENAIKHAQKKSLARNGLVCAARGEIDIQELIATLRT